jgi:hypothetical protein
VKTAVAPAFPWNVTLGRPYLKIVYRPKSFVPCSTLRGSPRTARTSGRVMFSAIRTIDCWDPR